jgi:uncharacterized protein
MASFSDKYGEWALVTGAALGLGAEFARQLVQRGLKVILVDKQAGPLAEMTRTLAAENSGQVRACPFDLAAPDGWAPLWQAIADLEVGLVVNNAGISAIGHFLDVPLETHLRLLDVNTRAALVLAYHLGGLMRARRRGGLIFVSSMSGLIGTTYVSEYSATKAHNLALGEALWAELRPYGVDVLTAIVGATDTPGWRAENPRPEAKTWPPVMLPGDTVRETLAALGRAPSLVPGAQNRLASFITSRLLPRRSAISTLDAAMRQRYEAAEGGEPPSKEKTQ